MSLNPVLLPDPATTRRRAKALAMMDAIVCPTWEYRYYSYNANWGNGEELGSMRNGSGDEWFLLFASFGTALKGVAHEYPLAGDKSFTMQVQKQVPANFSTFLNEPAFDMEHVSFCYWHRCEDAVWHQVIPTPSPFGNVDDGSENLLALLYQSADAYVTFANQYYAAEIPLVAVESIYRHDPLTDALVYAINPNLAVADIDIDIKASAIEIGYPLEWH